MFAYFAYLKPQRPPLHAYLFLCGLCGKKICVNPCLKMIIDN
jgi:hypothetical protein